MTSTEEKLGYLAGRVADHDVALAPLVTVPQRLDSIEGQLADLVVAVNGEKSKGYQPAKNPRWWDIPATGQRKAAEVGRVRGWYRNIAVRFLPCDGIPECVLDHEVTVLMLDAACETWKTLWIPEKRTSSMAAAQCEWYVRIWPGIKEQLTKALVGCEHRTGMRLAGAQ